MDRGIARRQHRAIGVGVEFLAAPVGDLTTRTSDYRYEGRVSTSWRFSKAPENMIGAVEYM
jgi:hypothetical protein